MVDDDDADPAYDDLEQVLARAALSRGVRLYEEGDVISALSALETAAQTASVRCTAEAARGTIHLERGEWSDAVDAFIRALRAPVATPVERDRIQNKLAAANDRLPSRRRTAA